MPALKPGEVHNPKKGVCDTQLVGDGILDFDHPQEGGRFIAAKLRFQDEGEFMNPNDRDDERFDYAAIELFSEARSYEEDGYSPEDAEELASAVRVLLKYVERSMK